MDVIDIYVSTWCLADSSSSFFINVFQEFLCFLAESCNLSMKGLHSGPRLGERGLIAGWGAGSR